MAADVSHPTGNVLIRQVETPSSAGASVVDVLVVGGTIAEIQPAIGTLSGFEYRELDGSGRVLVASFIDQHTHPTGGGGAGGPETLSFPIPVERYIESGIGTVVGCMGHDSAVRRPEALLARVKGLRRLGLGAHMFTGEIGFPPETITGDLRRDLALIDEVRGVKAAVGGIGSIRTRSDLAFIAGEATRGSRTAGRAPILHLHVEPDPASVSLIIDAIEAGDVKASTVTITHVNWNETVLAESVRAAGLGANLDVTACLRPDYFAGCIEPDEAILRLLDQVDPHLVTVSSDSGGNHLGDDGTLLMHQPDLLADTFARAGASGRASLGKLVQVFTTNPATRLGLDGVGRLARGARADLLLLDSATLMPVEAFLGGRQVLSAGSSLISDQAANIRNQDGRPVT